jgi:hypothetical protein
MDTIDRYAEALGKRVLVPLADRAAETVGRT